MLHLNVAPALLLQYYVQHMLEMQHLRWTSFQAQHMRGFPLARPPHTRNSPLISSACLLFTHLRSPVSHTGTHLSFRLYQTPLGHCFATNLSAWLLAI